MGYKKVDKTVSFAELSLLSSIENNRSLKMMRPLHNLPKIVKTDHMMGYKHTLHVVILQNLDEEQKAAPNIK